MNKPTQHYSMADVSAKPRTARRALAAGRITVGDAAFERLQQDRLPKGNALALAEIAGIQAAKQTPMLIPLCHPIALSRVLLRSYLRPDSAAVDIYSLAEINQRTGVEMEALCGVSIALLTVWDLVKPVNPALQVSEIRLLYKEGGKSGRWVHPDGLPAEAEALLNAS